MASAEESIMRRRLRRNFWLVVTVAAALVSGAFLGACAGTKGEDSGKGAARSAATGPDDIEVFFRTASIGSIGDQGLPEYPAADPGESTKLGRDFPDAPPQIPHAVDDMYPITLSGNDCLDCHHPDNALGADDVPLPESHFMEPIMGEGEAASPMVWVVKGYAKAQHVAGARFNCNLCHTPQATNVATPRNDFDAQRSMK
jgi:nitrate reductase cytochrome c-type subunit